MSSTDEGREKWIAAGLSLVFLAIAILAVADLVADAGASISGRHILVEGGLALAGLAGFVGMALRVRRLRLRARALVDQARDLEVRLSESRADAEAWRAEARDLIAGLGVAIDQQLERWGLSPAEKDVAMLLLKGLSHKEIADVRQVSEATVRQQARALYRKAGLSGRADLAAFFLEDLLSPRASAREQGGAPT